MNRTLLLLGAIAALFQGCGPADPNKVVVNGSFEVEPGKFMFHKVTLEGMGNFTLTVAPQGGDVEAWLAPGDAPPLVVYNPNDRSRTRSRSRRGRMTARPGRTRGAGTTWSSSIGGPRPSKSAAS